MASLLEDRLVDTAEAVNNYLNDILQNKNFPPRLSEAMRYVALGGGKHIRSFLVIETARLFGKSTALPIAASLECIHCYSLIHDDLPSMDNDTLRRGKPTLHVAYDEATAILAGDSLLTLAFEILSGAESVAPATRLLLLRELAHAAGAAGMAGGQMLDLAAEGRFDKKTPLQLTEDQILYLQVRKTGALIRYAVRAGARVGAAPEDKLQNLTLYAEMLGVLFQLADDLIDATGSESAAGKTVAKDRPRGKATLVACLGVEGARERLRQIVILCEAALEGFESAKNLKMLPRYVAARAL